jgi:(p)ppGpp synthase/HD superfamily hydrolase
VVSLRMSEDIVIRARSFATAAHAGQTRKYTGEPYITHCAAVAELVAARPHTPEMLAAAWLHDTVEDTTTTIEDVRGAFGEVVAALVADLTDVSRPEDGNRKARKAIDRAHTAMASPEAKTVKLADLIDNSKSIIDHDSKFAQVYMAEKAELLKVLREGDPSLWAIGMKLIEGWLHSGGQMLVFSGSAKDAGGKAACEEL